MIDTVTNGQLKAQLLPHPTGTTFRWHVRRLTQGDPFWYWALDTVLAPAMDRPISQWDESFLPVKFAGFLSHVAIKDPGGAPSPLVLTDDTLYKSIRPPEPAAPPIWWPRFFLIGAAFAAIFIALGQWARRKRAGRLLFALAATFYTLALGLCGFIGLFLWLCTAHWPTYRNENLFEYSPLALPLALLLPFIFQNRPRMRNMSWRWRSPSRFQR